VRSEGQGREMAHLFAVEMGVDTVRGRATATTGRLFVIVSVEILPRCARNANSRTNRAYRSAGHTFTRTVQCCVRIELRVRGARAVPTAEISDCYLCCGICAAQLVAKVGVDG
jgi:hypothetical protein